MQSVSNSGRCFEAPLVWVKQFLGLCHLFLPQPQVCESYLREEDKVCQAPSQVPGSGGMCDKMALLNSLSPGGLTKWGMGWYGHTVRLAHPTTTSQAQQEPQNLSLQFERSRLAPLLMAVIFSGLACAACWEWASEAEALECSTGWGQERGGSHSTCLLGADSLREETSSAKQHENAWHSCPEWVREVCRSPEGRQVLSHQEKLPEKGCGREGGRVKGTQGLGLTDRAGEGWKWSWLEEVVTFSDFQDHLHRAVKRIRRPCF